MKRKTLVTIIQLIVFLGIGVLVIWYMFFRQMTAAQRADMAAAVRSTNLWYVLPVAAVTIIAHWARARRWQIMLHPLGIRPSTANTTLAVLIGYLINLVPPRAGEVAKCTVLARYEGVPADKMVGTIVAERAWDVVCLLIVIGLGLLLQGDELGQYLRAELKGRTPSGQKVLFVIGAIAGFIGALVLIYRRYRHSRVGRFIGGLGEGVGSILRLKQRGMFMLYTFLIWGGYLAQIQLGFWSIPATAHLGIGAALMTLIFGSFAMIAAPGGIGLYPLMVGRMLNKGYGTTLATGNAFGWVSWTFLTGLIIVFGIFSLLLLPVVNRRRHTAISHATPPAPPRQNL